MLHTFSPEESSSPCPTPTHYPVHCNLSLSLKDIFSNTYIHIYIHNFLTENILKYQGQAVELFNWGPRTSSYSKCRVKGVSLAENKHWMPSPSQRRTYIVSSHAAANVYSITRKEEKNMEIWHAHLLNQVNNIFHHRLHLYLNHQSVASNEEEEKIEIKYVIVPAPAPVPVKAPTPAPPVKTPTPAPPYTAPSPAPPVKAPTPPYKPPTPTPPVKAPTPPYKPPTPAPPTKAPAPPYKPPTPSPPYKPPTTPAPPNKPPTTPAPPYKAPPTPTPPYKAPPTPTPPYKPPSPPLPPVRTRKDCTPLCEQRCRLHSRTNLCMRACITCCDRCKCVPPGTSGNREMCGKCYTEMKTHRNKPKCP
ncbi:Gibberellin-regulated family protein [Theobroma cacao]|uniref:Gibberellin-regulated family protein n=1 Tax=Theobroma cacao TaxID=3641 RepID=A0A061ECE2_THECC|nr:Gibberellin-regulated family protein [Theobroma cacao]